MLYSSPMIDAGIYADASDVNCLFWILWNSTAQERYHFHLEVGEEVKRIR